MRYIFEIILSGNVWIYKQNEKQTQGGFIEENDEHYHSQYKRVQIG